MIELEEDIIAICGIFIFMKLADGLSDYPYLTNLNLTSLSERYDIDAEKISIITQLLKEKEIIVKTERNAVLRTIPQETGEFDAIGFVRGLERN